MSAAAAVVVSRRIQPSKSDAQLNYSAHLSTDRRVPDVLDPTAEVEVEVEEEDSSYSSKKGKNSKRGKRQKRKKQSIASGKSDYRIRQFLLLLKRAIMLVVIHHVVKRRKG